MSGRPLLVIDTATTQAVIALGTADGTLVDQRGWVAGYRHGEELLAQIAALLADRGVAASDLGGVIIGTGPGAFTGLRVGLATAKGLAHGLALPIVGLATGASLLQAAAAASGLDARTLVLVQPAGMSDKVVSREGAAARIIAGGTEPELGPDDHLVAVDLAARAPDEAVRLGAAAVAGLAAAMLAAGAARLTTGDADDLALLVPEYVTLPRGVRLALPDEGVVVSGGTSDPARAAGTVS
jgi:tRNA threonylcarbamoyl adenosine modification protein YeaZ